MSTNDAARWDERYDGHPLTAATAPDAIVAAAAFDLIPTSGRALDVACGAGGQTVWLAHCGLDVVALDASTTAITLTVAAAEASGVADRVTARVADLDDGIPVDLGDFDVIVCQRFRDLELYDSFVARLRPGGIAVVTVLSRSGAQEPGRVHAPPGELRDAFTRPDADILFHDESAGLASVILRRRSDRPR
jgi:2-polyprenyl-3-methyl-5-hydroxy-6-metoxy-1,4-benzoquinol methylase